MGVALVRLNRPTLAFLSIVAIVLMVGCDGSASSEYSTYAQDTVEAPDEARASRMTRDDALDDAAALQQGMTYSDLGEPYGCTEDCSGHEAGAEWAADNDLRDPADCGGRSQSFLEGCQAYAEAVQQAADEIERGGY